MHEGSPPNSAAIQAPAAQVPPIQAPAGSTSSHSRASRGSSPKCIYVRTPRASHTPRVRSSKATSVRTSTGHIKRSAAAKDAFERETGYPHGRKGYVVDHKIAWPVVGQIRRAICNGRPLRRARLKTKPSAVGAGAGDLLKPSELELSLFS
jgi:hypothetical protein